MDVKYRTTSARQHPEWLCFKHAVQAAMSGEEIETVVDDYGADEDLRDTVCADCRREW